MTNSPTRFTAHDVPDLINALPTLFGFRPRESLVAIATHGPRRRFGFRMRMDLPGVASSAAAARMVVGHLRNNHAEGAILIAVTQHQDTALALLDAIHRELDDCGDIELIVRARADDERYWTDELAAPPDGTAYELSLHHLSIVQAVAAGQEILRDREELVARFQAVSGERRRWLEAGATAVLAEVVPQVARSTPGELSSVGMSVVGPILERGLAGEAMSDADLLRVAIWVSCVSVRDEVWGRITHDSAREMLTVLTTVSQSVVPPFEPAVLSLTAFAAWLAGDGAQAIIAVERALDADPCYSMACLFLRILDDGIPPTAWGAARMDEATQMGSEVTVVL
ncbi:DUF4192 domain-containing protein [Aeromicrobium sp. P5_D10]